MTDSVIKPSLEPVKEGPKEVKMTNYESKIDFSKASNSCLDLCIDDEAGKRNKIKKPCLKRVWDENECIYSCRLAYFGPCFPKCIPPL